MKDFADWFEHKKTLNSLSDKPPNARAGDIFWVGVGVNIGHETDGKGRDFSRPVIILTRLYSELYFVIPLSTQVHSGSWFVPFEYKGYKVVACLHQARTIDYRRLYNYAGSASYVDLQRIKKGFGELHDL